MAYVSHVPHYSPLSWPPSNWTPSHIAPHTVQQDQKVPTHIVMGNVQVALPSGGCYPDAAMYNLLQSYSRTEEFRELVRDSEGLEETRREGVLTPVDSYIAAFPEDVELNKVLLHYRSKVSITYEMSHPHYCKKLPVFHCNIPQCGFSSRSTRHFVAHMCTTFPCRQCPRMFHREVQLERHRGTHARKLTHLCELCGQHRKSSRALLIHQGSEHHFCNKCNLYFDSKDILVEHLQDVHGATGLYDCGECGELFFGEEKLAVHKMSKHNPMQKVACPYCDKPLAPQSLRVHVQRLHEKKKNFKCQFCSYEAYDTYMMKEHMRRHLGEYQYKCEQCNFMAVKKYQLESHMRRHTGEKRFRCHHCNFISAWNVQLKAHIRQHETGSLSFFCAECGIAFKDLRALNMHQKGEHPHLFLVPLRDQESMFFSNEYEELYPTFAESRRNQCSKVKITRKVQLVDKQQLGASTMNFLAMN